MLNHILVQATTPSSDELQWNCGTGISSMCEGKTVTMDEAGWQLLNGELVAAVNFLSTAMAEGIAAGGSLDMIRAINSARCALVAGGDSFWYFIAGLWYLLLEFNSEQWLKEQLDLAYPYICTCKEESDKVAKWFGGNPTTKEVMSSCSAEAQ